MFENQVKEAFQWNSTTIDRNRFALLPKLQQENCPSMYRGQIGIQRSTKWSLFCIQPLKPQ